MCPGGLPTFVPLAPKFFEIHIILDEGDEPQLKNIKKRLILQMQRDLGYAIFMGQMMKNISNDIHHVKSIVYSVVIGKDVMLGPESNTLEKHTRKIKVVQDMPHLGKKQREFYVNKKCNHVKNEIIYFQHNYMTIVKHVI